MWINEHYHQLSFHLNETEYYVNHIESISIVLKFISIQTERI